MERRQLILAAGATAAAGLAGCFGGGSSDTSSPQAAAEAYLEAAQNQNEDRLASVVHPELNTSSDSLNLSDQGNQTSVENIETETTVEDISAGDIEAGGGFFGGVTVGEYTFFANSSKVNTVAESNDMAIVETRSEGEDGIGALLTATDDGDWYVIGLGERSERGNETGSPGQ